MKKACLLLFSSMLLSPLTVQAEENSQTALKNLLAQMTHYSASFQQTVSDEAGDIVHEATGTLTMTRPDKLRWETAYPDETLLIADGDAVWNIDTFVEQVTIIDQTQAIADNPVILLTSNDPAVWNDFTVSKASDDIYTVTPKNGEGQIQSLTMRFNDDILASLEMLDAQSQTSNLVFSSINVSDEPDSSLFTVTIPDTYMIDDQR
ncbi:outer membrane lipoprotein chaperone LolA [Alteromonas sp. H39]|uniref:outer membrane lipoprotein chaperone LolA n=1 Tax=Alteromonas sp. H39 TaxID=3389876 RepID=UPI0039DF6052